VHKSEHKHNTQSACELLLCRLSLVAAASHAALSRCCSCCPKPEEARRGDARRAHALLQMEERSARGSPAEYTPMADCKLRAEMRRGREKLQQQQTASERADSRRRRAASNERRAHTQLPCGAHTPTAPPPHHAPPLPTRMYTRCCLLFSALLAFRRCCCGSPTERRKARTFVAASINYCTQRRTSNIHWRKYNTNTCWSMQAHEKKYLQAERECCHALSAWICLCERKKAKDALPPRRSDSSF